MDSRSLRVVASARASLALRDEFPHWWVPRVSKRCLEEIWQISPLVSPWYLSLYTVGHQKGPLKKIGLEDDVAYKFQNRLSVGRRFVVWPFGIFSGFYVRRCCQPRMVGSFEGRVNCCILLLGLWFPPCFWRGFWKTWVTSPVFFYINTGHPHGIKGSVYHPAMIRNEYQWQDEELQDLQSHPVGHVWLLDGTRLVLSCVIKRWPVFQFTSACNDWPWLAYVISPWELIQNMLKPATLPRIQEAH